MPVFVLLVFAALDIAWAACHFIRSILACCLAGSLNKPGAMDLDLGRRFEPVWTSAPAIVIGDRPQPHLEIAGESVLVAIR